MKSAAACVLALLCILAAACGGDEDDDELPVVLDFGKSLATGFANPTGSPPGADDPDCQPPEDHPRPVVLVHGTFNNRSSTWNALAPLLKNKGYCVFSLNFGARHKGSPLGAVTDMRRSAKELATFVDGVLRKTGTDKVDIVGYSQGGMMPRQYLRFEGGAEKVASLIALAPSNHGTNANLKDLSDRFATRIDEICPACRQQIKGSDFLTRLNRGFETFPDIRYTVIVTKHDQVLTPYELQFLKPGLNVENITLQDTCAKDLGDHLSIPFDSVALGHVTNALDPGNATPPRCVPVKAGVGG